MGYHMDLENPVCKMTQDPDMSGPFSRDAAIIAALATIITIFAHFITRKPYTNLAGRFSDIALYITGFSLAYAIVLASAALYNQRTTNWFDARFLFDSPSLAANSVLFTALAVPGYFTRNIYIIPGVVVHFSLMIALFVAWIRTYLVAFKNQPGCYDKQYLVDVCIYASVDVVVYVGICIALAICNREIPQRNNVGEEDKDKDDEDDDINDQDGKDNGIRRWYTKGFWRRWGWSILTVATLLAFTAITALEIGWSWSDYNALRGFLIDPPPVAAFGQIVPLATVCALIALAYCMHFDVNGNVNI
ncbi:hypothetical protein LTR17_007350 [Elasticomyces elasticus]|nr:hypothetical protein LTR17_007350 [Elasticomyces elasticus]